MFIKSMTETHRRCGYAFTRKGAAFADGTFSDEQIKILKADSHLMVTDSDPRVLSGADDEQITDIVEYLAINKPTTIPEIADVRNIVGESATVALLSAAWMKYSTAPVPVPVPVPAAGIEIGRLEEELIAMIVDSLKASETTDKPKLSVMQDAVQRVIPVALYDLAWSQYISKTPETTNAKNDVNVAIELMRLQKYDMLGKKPNVTDLEALGVFVSAAVRDQAWDVYKAKD